MNFVAFISEQFKQNDIIAGGIYSGWGTAIMLWSAITWIFVDYTGPAYSLFITSIILAVSRFIMSYFNSLTAFYITIFIIMPFGK